MGNRGTENQLLAGGNGVCHNAYMKRIKAPGKTVRLPPSAAPMLKELRAEMEKNYKHMRRAGRVRDAAE